MKLREFVAIGFLFLNINISAQSVRDGVDESNFGLIEARDFDFAGVWQANRFEVVYDTIKKEIVEFEFRDSINNLVFLRMTGLQDIKAYAIEPIVPGTGFPYLRIGLFDDEYAGIGFARDSSYQFDTDVKLYGADAIQFNEDVPESESFFGHTYKESEDLNVFWELIRTYPY